ncbi:unnamed protein product [Protopolystoma xenopodis]|uniref:Uncharacterized protein n=1 Tax=Protopolystoma xenopodis TaxID=117903 RepID=A0A448WZG0_9PLAT|nr:unnamed protein product [Protopolystoma xenopodis]
MYVNLYVFTFRPYPRHVRPAFPPPPVLPQLNVRARTARQVLVSFIAFSVARVTATPTPMAHTLPHTLPHAPTLCHLRFTLFSQEPPGLDGVMYAKAELAEPMSCADLATATVTVTVTVAELRNPICPPVGRTGTGRRQMRPTCSICCRHEAAHRPVHKDTRQSS